MIPAVMFVLCAAISVGLLAYEAIRYLREGYEDR